jgi:opacity protein-like surface antigen
LQDGKFATRPASQPGDGGRFRLLVTTGNTPPTNNLQCPGGHMTRPLLLAALALLAAPAMAADNGIYLGAGIGLSNVTVDDVDSLPDFDEDDTGFKVIAGIRPLDWLGAELNYIDFGSPTGTAGGTRVETEATALAGFAVAFLELPLVDLYGKLGVVRWDASVKATDFGLSADDSGTDLAWGLGVQARLLSLGLRLEYERFELGSFDETSFLSLSVTYTFL